MLTISAEMGVFQQTQAIAQVCAFCSPRGWVKGDDIASEEIKNKILEIGINKCARESGFHRANFIRKLVRGIPVKRNSYEEFLRWVTGKESEFKNRQ
jgi:hypothetical protein